MSDDKQDQVIKDIRIEARVPIEHAELEQLGAALGEANKALSQLKFDERLRAKAAKNVIKTKEILVAKLSEDVLSKTKEGMVDGFERWDYDTWQVDTVRRDTGEVVSVRPMSAEERREWKEPELPMDLDLSEKGPPGEGDQKVVLTKKNKQKGNGAAKAEAH